MAERQSEARSQFQSNEEENRLEAGVAASPELQDEAEPQLHERDLLLEDQQMPEPDPLPPVLELLPLEQDPAMAELHPRHEVQPRRERDPLSVERNWRMPNFFGIFQTRIIRQIPDGCRAAYGHMSAFVSGLIRPEIPREAEQINLEMNPFLREHPMQEAEPNPPLQDQLNPEHEQDPLLDSPSPEIEQDPLEDPPNPEIEQDPLEDPPNPEIAQDPLEDPLNPEIAQDLLEDPPNPEIAEDPLEDPPNPEIAEDPHEDPLNPEIAKDPHEDPPNPEIAEDPLEDPPNPEIAEDPLEDPSNPEIAEDPLEDPPNPKISQDPLEDPPNPEIAQDPLEDPPNPETAKDPLEDPPNPEIAEDPHEDPPNPEIAQDPLEDPPNPEIAEDPLEDPLNPEVEQDLLQDPLNLEIGEVPLEHPQNAEQDSPVHEPNPPNQQNQPENPAPAQHGIPICCRFLMCLRDLFIWHCLLTIIIVVMISFALFFNGWREILVNREALLKKTLSGSDDVSMNSTIAFSRSQGIFQECFINPSLSNETNTSSKTGCHPFRVESIPNDPLENQKAIHGLILAEWIMGSFILAFVIAAAINHVLASVWRKYRLLIYLVNCFVRIVGAFLCWIFFTLSIDMDNRFEMENPAYPVSWPKAVRNASEVYLWQPGHIIWIFGMVVQLIIVGLDLRLVPGPNLDNL